MEIPNAPAIKLGDNLLAADLPPSYARWLVLAVFLAGLALRLVGLSAPPYDSHSFRQTQTLSTIEDYYANGIDLLYPKTIYMGYPGTFVLELPLFQATAALLYRVFGPHLEIVRLLNILLGAGATWLVFKITCRFLGCVTGIVAAMIYWFAPLNIIYQRSMLIDPAAVLCGLLCFHQMAKLLVPEVKSDAKSPDNTFRDFAVFAMAALLTALIKALYLWPAVLLLGQHLLARRGRVDRKIAQIIAVFALAGICFLAWNVHAMRVNDLSPFTRGVKPTSLLGFSALLDPEYYRDLFLHRTKRWLGAIGILFYVLGAVVLWLQRKNSSDGKALFLFFMIPPTYLVCFANINRPHDYYQLVITPFLAIIAASGVVWLGKLLIPRVAHTKTVERGLLASAATLFVMVSAVTLLVVMRHPNLDPGLIQFEKLCAGKFEPRRPAMVLVNRRTANRNPNSYIPEFIYAAHLWGFGHTVEDDLDARRYFDELAPAFSKLDYVVFYGTPFPTWIPQKEYREFLHDDEHRLYVFRSGAAQ